MTSISINRTISAPLDRVWEVFTDIPGCVDRIKGVTAIEVLTGPDFVPGFQWKETRTMMGRQASETMWVTAVTAKEFYEVAAHSHGTEYLSRYQFTEVPLGTEVRYTFSADATSSAAKLMSLTTGWLAKKMVRKQLAQDLEDLATAAEASA